MKKSNTLNIGLAIAAALVFGGCSKAPERAKVEPEKMTPTVTESERPGTSAPSDISPATARLRVSDLKVGSTLDAEGKVAENTDEFDAGQDVAASIAVGDVGAGSRIKAVWIGPDEIRIHEEVKDVPTGTAFLIFRAPDTTAWAAGDYKVEIFLGDELAGSESFDIVTRIPA